MSKLDELIAEFCPDGVEYRRVGDIADYEQPSKYLVKSTDYNDNFEIPVLTAGQTFILGYTNEKEGIYNASPEKPVIIFDDFTGAFKWVDFPFKAKSSAMKMITSKSDVLIRYLYHLMGFLNYSSDEHKRLWISVYSELQVPVPHLEVQREIVHILDSFTLLTAELTAELTARKKQYEFYRDNLIKKEQHISEVKKLADVANIYDSLHQTPSYSNSGYSMVRVQDIKGGYVDEDKTLKVDESVWNLFTQKYTPRLKDIVVSRVGSYGNFALIPNDKCCLGQNVALIHPNINPKYLYHVLMSTMTKQWINNNVKGASQKSFSLADIKRVPVPVPKENIQQRIAEVLDNFEAICTDLNIGLPAEIEARQKQYEYYRDLLLTFAETGSTLMTDRQTDRQTELSAIKLIQYVFGYVTLPMGSLFDFRNGLSKGKDFFGSGIPFIRYTDVYNNRFLKGENITALVECTPAEIEKLGVHRGDVFFTRTSETAEDVGWSSVMLDDIGDCVFNGFTIKATPKTNYLLPEYCAFCFATEDFRKYVTSHCAFTTRASLTGKTIAEYQLAIPSIEKQQEIVNVLNKFHSLCNDLSAGLPAEIEARQKQYEYYRDKLLSFKELS